MQQELEKKSNKKIHIIFAIFTLIVSFGISFSNISAKTDVDYINKCFEIINSAPYQLSIKFNSYYENDGVWVGYESVYYYLYSEKPSYFEERSNYLHAFNEKGESITPEVYQYLGENNNYAMTNGKPNMIYLDSGYVGTGTYYDASGNQVNVPITSLIVTSTFDVYIDNNLVFQKPTVPMAIVVESLPEAVGVQAQVIIGSTILLLGLVIFLVVLVRHFKKVSQV